MEYLGGSPEEVKERAKGTRVVLDEGTRLAVLGFQQRADEEDDVEEGSLNNMFFSFSTQ